jgi:hypothetical protein
VIFMKDPAPSTAPADGSSDTAEEALLPVDAAPVAVAKDAAYRHVGGILHPAGEQGETRVWSEALATDMNGDKVEDRLVIIEEAVDGAPRTFYVATLVSTDGGFRGGVAHAIGNGIAVQNYRITQGEVQVNYADRYPWEPEDARPSIGKTKRLAVAADGMLSEKSAAGPDASILRDLAVKAWGACDPSSCTVETADGADGVWYLVATHEGLEDDSIAAERRYAPLISTEGAWTVGATLHTVHACHEGRGHTDFSEELCI